jgi:DNA-binding transcriptional regulator YiaG
MAPTKAAAIVLDGLGADTPDAGPGPRSSEELTVVDQIIAANLVSARQESGMSAHVLASRLTGRMSAHAYYRWERGAIKIAGARLWELSIILEKPISYFFDGARGFLVGMSEDRTIKDIISPQTMDALRMISVINEDRRAAVMTMLGACMMAELVEAEALAQSVSDIPAEVIGAGPTTNRGDDTLTAD